MWAGSAFWTKSHDGQLSHGILLHSSPQRKRLRVQIPCTRIPGGGELSGAAAWGRASPNHPITSCFSFLRSFNPEPRISPVCLQPPENFWRGQRASGCAKAYAYLGLGENKANTTRLRLALGFFARKNSPHPPPSSGLDPASLQVSL